MSGVNHFFFICNRAR